MTTVAPIPRRIAAVAATLFAAATTLIVPAALPSASADPCPDVELVFARGTSEAPGIGRVGQALADTLQSQLGGRTLGTYAVNYGATYDFLGTADGATDATNHIAYMAQNCPNTRIVLGGYSQGAAVVDMLVGVPPLGNRIGEIGSAPPLPGSPRGQRRGRRGVRQPRREVRQPGDCGEFGRPVDRHVLRRRPHLFRWT